MGMFYKATSIYVVDTDPATLFYADGFSNK